jgi:hypothetical protein
MQYRSLMIGVALVVMSGATLADPVDIYSNNTTLSKTVASRSGGRPVTGADQVYLGPNPIRVGPQPSPMPQPIAPIRAVLPVQPAPAPKLAPINPPFYTNPGFKTPKPGPVRATPGLAEQPISRTPPVRDTQ